MANFEFEQFLVTLLDSFSKLRQTVTGVPSTVTHVEGMTPLVYTPFTFRKSYESLLRNVKRFGSDRVVISIILLLRKRAPRICTLVYFVNAYLDLRELIRNIDPTFEFGQEEEKIFIRVAQHLNGEHHAR